MKGAAIEHIAAARFHSVVATDTHVYTFGLNAGQLGHAKSEKHCSVCNYYPMVLCYAKKQLLCLNEYSNNYTI